MKNLLIISICILISACSKPSEKQFTVSGNINNSKISIAELITSDTIYVDTIKNGCFTFTIPTTSEKYIDLKIGKKILLYVKPNDSVFVNYEDKNNFTFSGHGYAECEFLSKKKQLIKKLGFDDPRKIDIALFSSDPQIFQAKIDSVKQIQLKLITDYKQQYPEISDSFTHIEQQLIDYFVFNQLFLYPGFNEMLTKKQPKLSDNYYSFSKQIEPNKKELYSFNEYKSAIKSLLDLQTETFTEKYLLAKDMLTDSDFFEDIIYNEFISYINFNGIDDIDSICVSFINELTNSERKGNLKDKYDNWKKFAKGKKAPDFEIKDDKGGLVHLSDFKGKYVYIDCWSSYCGPCIAEMPAMKKLSDELANKNIVFISISADTDIERWLCKLKELDLNTVNLCTEGANHNFNNNYNAKAFPRYILIDKEGLIIDASAEKPSLIKERLEQLL